MSEPAGPEPGAGSDRDFIQSIERGFAVLLAFDADLPHPTLAEVAERTGYSRPAVRRILLTLQRLGYVVGARGRWTLTPRVLTIGQHYSASHGIVEIAQPHLLRVVERTGESASLAQLDGTDVVYVARVNARRVLSLNVDIGTRLPAHATSMGRVLVAHARASVVDRIIEEAGLPALTPRTITDPIVFRDALHDVRRKGYAVVDGELEEGFLSAAVPVRDGKGVVVAALAYSTSRGRRTPEQVEEDVVPVLLEVAEAIGTDLEAVGLRSGMLVPGPRTGGF
jgi:IclR family pca regulon transcriptional regulator